VLTRLRRGGDPRRINAHPVVAAALSDWHAGRIGDFLALKLLAGMAAARHDEAGWRALLLAYDPALPRLDPGGRVDLGGIGPGALNSGRLLTRPDGLRYEKIYDLGGGCFRRMLFAYQRMLQPSPETGFAALRSIRRGERLAAVEFDHVPGLDPSRRQGGLALATARRLAALPPPAGAAPRSERYPAALGSRRAALLDTLRRRGTLMAERLPVPPPLRRVAAQVLGLALRHDRALAARLPALLDRWASHVQAMPPVFGHGDLNRANLAPDGRLIDWDNAGWRPYGREAAWATAQHCPPTGLDVALALSAAQVERPGHETADRFAYLFFLLHFLPEAGTHRLPPRLARSLVAELDRLEARLPA